MKNCMKPLSLPWATPEETAAGEAGEPYFDRLCQRFPPQEAEDIWDAALSAGAAGREELLPPGLPPGGPADAGPPLRRGRGAGDKNALPSPAIGTRAFQTLRGATQIQACGHAPLTLCCGRGDRARPPGPLVALSSPGPSP